ncbi:hypothetical protein NC652_013717 [Populus alba x Populus x berolinensis]|nr:hypothetical protein NC652_013717 [Populus alba x Populus x berolinensis]
MATFRSKRTNISSKPTNLIHVGQKWVLIKPSSNYIKIKTLQFRNPRLATKTMF